MHSFIIRIIVCFTLLSWGYSAYAQHELWVDDYAFVCEPDADAIDQSLQNGANAILLELEESEAGYILVNSGEGKNLELAFDQINEFLRNDNHSIISLIFKGAYNEDSIRENLSSIFSEKVFFKENDWPKMSLLQEQGIRIIAVFGQDISATSIWNVQQEKKYADRFSIDPLNILIWLNSEATQDSTLLSECYEVWRKTGRAPNFIVAKSLDSKSKRLIAENLNKKRRFRGEVYYNDELLNQINWYNSPGVTTPAKFSFPLIEKEQILSPYKNGYRITPSEVIHHVAMTDEPRIFTAYDVPIGDKLVYDFSFDNEVINAVEPEWSSSISKDVSFVDDEIRGDVLYLSAHNSFIDYSKENVLNFATPVSISVWVRPDSLPAYTGIVGIGSAFSFKLMGGNPDFTTATIKDHMINWKLDVGKWYHMVAVRNPEGTVDFFINGEKIGDSVTSDIIPSDQSLVIGNNIWGEQFYGSIDDLKIWNRGLSPKEITLLYQSDQVKKGGLEYWMLWLVFAIALGGFFVLRKRKSNSESASLRTREYLPKEGVQKNSLRLFGSFNVHSEQKGEISSAFSPLLRQILAYLILKTDETKDGVNTNKLTETFWPGVSKEKAKENRGANIKKLRKVLSEVEGLMVVFEDKKWHIETSSDFFVDVLEYSKLKATIEQDISAGDIHLDSLNALLDLLKQGNILQNMHAEWVDHFKNVISNEVDALLSKVYKSQQANLDIEVKIKLVNTILLFDSLNENALRILIKELVASGKHGQAQQAYESFTKNYMSLYAEPFGVEYQEIVEGKD
jgi:two-component SAPR family response regulator